MNNVIDRYDVAIVGGGLAGLCLSIQLAKAEIKTALFEKENYPFHKVCGEYISLESEPFLKSIGIDIKKLELPIIKKLKVSSPNGFSIYSKLASGGFGISRYKLDFMLYEIALKYGVDVYTGCKVNDITVDNEYTFIHTHKGSFNASLVCGSWGKRSNLDAKLNRSFIQPKNRRLSNFVGIKYHVKANLPDDIIELHNFKNGYCGISKIEDDKYCMCYLVSGSELKKAKGNIKKLEEETLYQNPFLKKYFTTFPFLYDTPLAISQISFEPKELFSNQIIMVGDAAGLITPLCGNGMSMAMHGSKLLAYELKKFFAGNISKQDMIKHYQKIWKAEFSSRLIAGRLIQQLFGKPVTTNIALKFLNRFPLITEKIISLTHGKPF